MAKSPVSQSAPRLLAAARAACTRARARVAPGAGMSVAVLTHELLAATPLRESAATKALADTLPPATHPATESRNPSPALRHALETLGERPVGPVGLLRHLLRTERCRAELLAAGMSDDLLAAALTALHAAYDPERELLAHLQTTIVGQDDAHAAIAAALSAGLGKFRDQNRPRGVMLFAGPTGVGKTETALSIAKLMGGPLIRFDCNMLAGGGSHDGTSMLWQLFGTGKGFKGMDDPSPLAELEERPDAVILFDEFEKADPRLGQVLLQAIDAGEILDPQRRKFDLRRCFILFTSNAGVETTAVAPGLGFAVAASGTALPTVSRDSLHADLTKMGHRPEFLARIPHWVIFRAMGPAELRAALALHLDALRAEFLTRGVELDLEPGLLDALTPNLDPRLGVRPALNNLRLRLARKLAFTDPADSEKPVRFTLGANKNTAAADYVCLEA